MSFSFFCNLSIAFSEINNTWKTFTQINTGGFLAIGEIGFFSSMNLNSKNDFRQKTKNKVVRVNGIGVGFVDYKNMKKRVTEGRGDKATIWFSK